MTIAEFFVKIAKKAVFWEKMRGLALNVPRLENAKLNAPTKEKLLTM